MRGTDSELDPECVATVRDVIRISDTWQGHVPEAKTSRNAVKGPAKSMGSKVVDQI
jgi:hypothetical protein